MYRNYRELTEAELSELDPKDFSRFALIYIDDNRVPELLEMGSSSTKGARIMVYHDGTLEETKVNRDFSYIRKGNLVYCKNGTGNVFSETLYIITGAWIDTRLLITSINFVGIVSTVLSLVVRMIYNRMLFGGFSSSSSSDNDRNNKGNGLSVIVIMLIGAVCAGIAYLFIMLTRFAISRKREFMADAGGAELCGNPLALASALRKISNNPGLGEVERDDIAQMYIIRPKQMAQGLMSFISGLFATHPSTEERIRILEQF